MGLRERKKEKVRQALRQAALTLFATKGFAETSVDEIVAAAEVSRSTFFRYFPSKEAVVFDGYDETGEIFAELLRNRPPDESALEAFEAAQQKLAEVSDVERHRAVAKWREQLMANDTQLRARHMEFVKRWEGTIAEIFAQRRGRSKVAEPDRLAASVCMSAANRVSDQWWSSGGTADPHALIATEFRLLRSLLGDGDD